MTDYIVAVLELPPDVLRAMFSVWVIVVGASLIVYKDARRHHIGPAPGRVAALTPGAIAALMLWFNFLALAVYMVKRKKLIERAAAHPSNYSGLITYIVWVVLYTAVFPIIANLN